MAVLSNFSIISSGMGIGYPAITLTLLTTTANDNVVLNDSQASWFGVYKYHAIHCFILCNLCVFDFLSF